MFRENMVIGLFMEGNICYNEKRKMFFKKCTFSSVRCFEKLRSTPRLKKSFSKQLRMRVLASSGM